MFNLSKAFEECMHTNILCTNTYVINRFIVELIHATYCLILKYLYGKIVNFLIYAVALGRYHHKKGDNDSHKTQCLRCQKEFEAPENYRVPIVRVMSVTPNYKVVDYNNDREILKAFLKEVDQHPCVSIKKEVDDMLAKRKEDLEKDFGSEPPTRDLYIMAHSLIKQRNPYHDPDYIEDQTIIIEKE